MVTWSTELPAGDDEKVRCMKKLLGLAMLPVVWPACAVVLAYLIYDYHCGDCSCTRRDR